VKLSEVEPFSGMLAAPKALMITGGPITVTVAVEVFPAPHSIEVTCTELFFTPAPVPCTFNDTVQEAVEANVPAAKVTTDEPPAAIAVAPQVLFKALGVATTKPAGRLSVKATPVSVTFVFGFVMLNVNEVVPFNGMAAAPNALVIAGGEPTVIFAVAVLPVPPLVELTAPEVFVN
jgi:hypothetical protein